MKTSAFLRNVPVLSGLSGELLERIAEEVEEVEIAAGDWIMREGEPADSLFIVKGGRVDVVAEGPPESLIRVLRRGDVLGELALLREGERSVSARARRDATLLELGRSAFEALIEQAPSFALGLTRALGSQLAASRTPLGAATPPGTIAVVGLDAGADVAAFARALSEALGGLGRTSRLDGGDLDTIDQAEHDNDRVVLDAGQTPGDEWSELCLREAHLVVALTSGKPDPVWLDRAKALPGCELIAFGPELAAGVIERLHPREVQVVSEPIRRPEAIAALARRLSGRSPGVVLSGGGARALAHLGVLEELDAAGLHFDRVGGVSLGSLVAGATAMDAGPEAVYEVFAEGMQSSPTNDFAIPAFSLIRGAKVRRLLTEAFGTRRVEELPLRFFSVSCDLIARELVVHKAGPLVDAIYQSLAIPGVFPPVATADGRLLVDGGVLDNLPVATMARAGEGPVVAVDVTGRLGRFQRPQRPGLDGIGRRVRRALTGSEAEVPRLGETIVRTLTVGSIDTVAAARLHAELLISPEVDGIGLMDWEALGRVREIGRRAARQALEADPDLPRRLLAPTIGAMASE